MLRRPIESTANFGNFGLFGFDSLLNRLCVVAVHHILRNRSFNSSSWLERRRTNPESKMIREGNRLIACLRFGIRGDVEQVYEDKLEEDRDYVPFDEDDVADFIGAPSMLAIGEG